MAIQVVDEVSESLGLNDWSVCLQWCVFPQKKATKDAPGSAHTGYRLIYRDHKKRQRPYRGQTRIIALSQIERLMAMARAMGWGDRVGTIIDVPFVPRKSAK